MFVEIDGFLGRWARSNTPENASTNDPGPHRRAPVEVVPNLYMGHKPEALERRSIFGRALQELPAEGGGEVRRATVSAAQSNIKSAFIGVAKHRFRRQHS